MSNEFTMTIEAPDFARLARQLDALLETLSQLEEPDEVLNVNQASKLLQIGVNEVRGLARAGQLPAAKIGRGWRFSRRDLLEWMRRQARANMAQAKSKWPGMEPRAGNGRR
jgi:excisionase family DNA binding protein